MAFPQSRARRVLFWTLLIGFGVGTTGTGWIAYNLLTDLPDLQDIADYQPRQTSVVFDRHGAIIGEFAVERRTLASIDEIPEITKRAFISAEDGNFFEHGGIDFVSIARAAWVDITEGRIKQGASTITMQLVKQMLIPTVGRLNFRSKFRQMILARELEQHFTKDEILWLYLNQIYFGQGAWGVAEAARTYYDKAVSELTLSESALLAGLPQRPSEYSPTRNPKAAEKRRRYVLGRLRADAVIDDAQYAEALEHPPIIARPAYRANMHAAGYFTEEVRRFLYNQLGGQTVTSGGLRIETTLDIDLQLAAVAAVRRGIEAHDKRQGYRGPLWQVSPENFGAEIQKLATENQRFFNGANPVLDPLPLGVPLLGLVTAVHNDTETAIVEFGNGIRGEVGIEDVSWGRTPNPLRLPYLLGKIRHVFEIGDVAHFEIVEDKNTRDDDPLTEATGPAPVHVTLFQEPQIQGALVSVDAESGDVLALVGGYDFDGSEFNRATQARRQPGSAFKPFIYGAALNHDYTPVTTLWDRPAVYKDPESGFVWRPQNYGREFYGPMPMRTALARSVNNATVHLFRDIGVGTVIDYARQLGIRSPLNRDLSLALGSSDVTLLELTAAYAVFPNGGRRAPPRFITRVTRPDGTVVFENIALDTLEPIVRPLEETDEPAEFEQVISPANAFLMTDLLKATVFDPRGTGRKLKSLQRPIAGKTGTTNDQADAWFMGFSPHIATGVWVGHDETRVLGRGETGARAAAPIWMEYMREAMRPHSPDDFQAPPQIVFQRIDLDTGLLAKPDAEHAYFQPFLEGTGPEQTTEGANTASDTVRALRDDSF